MTSRQKLLGLLVLFAGVFFSFTFYYILPALYGRPGGADVLQPLKRYFPITDEFQSDNTIRVQDTLYHRIGPFQFIDQDGLPFSEKNLTDHIYIADFFFTRCGTICPKLSKSLEKLQTRLKDEKNLLFLSHTVDPDYDTPQILKEYGQRYNADFTRWKFLSGYTRDEFYPFVKSNYFVTAMPGAQGSVDMFDHTEKMVLVDRNRIIRGYYDGTDSLAMSRLVKDVMVLQVEYQQRKTIEYDPKRAPKK